MTDKEKAEAIVEEIIASLMTYNGLTREAVIQKLMNATGKLETAKRLADPDPSN